MLPIELWSKVLRRVDSLWRPVAARTCRDWRSIVIDIARIDAPCAPVDVPPAEHEALRLTERIGGVRERAVRRALWLSCDLLASAAALPHNSIAMLAWLRNTTDDDGASDSGAAPRPVPWDAAAAVSAARVGNLDTLLWLDANRCPLDQKECAEAAASGGHLAVLGWLRRRHEATASALASLGLDVPLWHDSIYAAAGRCGRIDVLRWLDIEGCPRSAQAFVEATRAGHLDVVRWLAATNGRVGPFVRPPFEAAHAAAERGDVTALECLYVAGCEGMGNPRLMEVAAMQGHVSVLAWLRTRPDPPCPWSRHVAPHAILGRRLDAFDWLVRAGCIVDANCFAPAALRNNIPLLAWLRRGDDDEEDDCARVAYADLIAVAEGDDGITRAQKEAVRRLPGLPKACAWSGSEHAIYLSAVCHDDVRVLDWLRVHGLTLTQDVAQSSYHAAMMYGCVRAAGWMLDAVPGVCALHLGSLLHPVREGLTRPMAWLRDNGIAWPLWTYAAVAKEGHVGMLAWMHAQTGSRSWVEATACHPDSACDLAAQTGQIDALDWLVEVGCWHEPARVMTKAATSGSYVLLKWCRGVWGWPWSSDITAAAATSGRPAAFVAALRDSGCPWDARVAEAYALRGDLDSLVALGCDGRPADPCPRDHSAIDAAARNGHYHVVTYLRHFIHTEESRH